MSNGEVCCILGVCCPPGSPQQRDHLVELIQKQSGCKILEAGMRAEEILREYDNFSNMRKLIHGK